MSQNKNKKSIVTPTGSGNQKKKEGGGGSNVLDEAHVQVLMGIFII